MSSEKVDKLLSFDIVGFSWIQFYIDRNIYIWKSEAFGKLKYTY